MGEPDNKERNESNDSWNWEPESSRLLRPPRRFLRTFLPIFLLLAAPAITGVWMLVVPEYTAQAEIRVRPIMDDGRGGTSMIPLYQSFMNTHVSIVLSPTVLQRVLDQRSVQQTKWYKDPPKPLLRDQAISPMERLRDSLSASPRRGTELIDVSFKARSAKDAEVIVNTVLDQYIAYIMEMANSTNDEAYRRLADQFKSMENEIQGREKVLVKLRSELGTGDPVQLIATMRVSLQEAERRYRDVRLEMSTAEWRQKRLEMVIDKIKAETKKRIEDEKKKKADGDKPAPASTPAPQPVPGSVKLETANFEPPFFDFKLAPPETDPVKSEADCEAELQTVTAELDLLKHQADLLLAEAQKQRYNFAEIFQSAQMLEKENESLRYKRNQFEGLRDRLYEMDLKRKAPGSIDILTRAIPSSKPSRDPRILLTILALLGAFVVGSTCGFIRARRMSKRYRISDLGALPETPFLGKLPLVRGCRRGAPKTDPDDQTLLNGVRIVSTALLARIGEKPGRMVLVTSPDAEAGRSSVAAMLAGNLARCGMKVLLVDADMRNGTLSKTFGLQQEPGVADSLCAATPLHQEHTFEGGIPNLRIMSAGPKACRRGVERIVRGRFAKCMEPYRNDYDVILLDGPPVLPVADARVLSEQADGTVLVVREGVTWRVDVTDALASLKSAGGNVLGTVVLGFERTEIHQASPPITGSPAED